MASSLKNPFITLAIFFGISVLAAFTQASVPQSQTSKPAEITKESLKEQTQSLVFFYTKTFLKRDRTQVIVPYTFDEKIPILFIGFSPVNQQDRTLYLISHPQISDLKWPSIKSGNTILFQKTKQYKSIEEFINASIDPQTVAIDPEVKKDFPSLTKAINTEHELNLDLINFILTNYLPSSLKDGIYYYKNTIDATTAKVNDRNEIEWFIKSTSADLTHPYKLGNISVDYLQ